MRLPWSNPDKIVVRSCLSHTIYPYSVYYRSRYYDPQIGRFTQPDPKGFIDGLNRYVYVMNSPVNYVDPWGMNARNSTNTQNSAGIWESTTQLFYQYGITDMIFSLVRDYFLALATSPTLLTLSFMLLKGIGQILVLQQHQ